MVTVLPSDSRVPPHHWAGEMRCDAPLWGNSEGSSRQSSPGDTTVYHEAEDHSRIAPVPALGCRACTAEWLGQIHGADDFDLNALVSRISQSKALGLFTKLSLKHDIDGLLENVRKYHDGSGDGSLEQLHERYDVLVHKLMILLQEKDGDLVKSIDDGRDKLWAILSDHEKFASI